MTKLEEAQKKVREAQRELRAAKKALRARKVGPLTLEKAIAMRERVKALEKREAALWATLKRRCPHDWKTTKRYDEPDCDGMFGGWVHYRDCKICGASESLPIDQYNGRVPR